MTEERKIYEVLSYNTISDDKVNAVVAALPEAEQEAATEIISSVKEKSNQKALAGMVKFPIFMLACYLILFFYFKSRGGYKAQVLAGHEADDEKFTGGVEGPAGE